MTNNTPITKEMIAYYQKTSLFITRIQSAIDFLEKKGIKSLNKDLFQSNSIFHAMGYNIFKLSNLPTFKNDLARREIRGGKKIMTADQIREIEHILQHGGLEDCELI